MSAFRHAVGRVRRWCASKAALSRYKKFGVACSYLLVDTPEHGNIGDQAIALAERQLLDDWFGSDSYYEVTAEQVDGFERAFAELSPRHQDILIPGGGFLGALWPHEEYRFRRILDAFKGHRVVVFPQTVTFDRATLEGEAFFQDSVASWCAHPDLTICCRERRSEQFISENFPGVRTLLMPDVVLGLEVPLMQVERRGVLLCMRVDRERSLDDAASENLRCAVQGALPREPIARVDTVTGHRVTPARREKEVLTKLAEFSRARLVITDRLHGMVFAAITGTPCIALNNSNGKVGRVYEWIAELPYVRFCQSVPEAIKAIQAGVPEPGVFPVGSYRERLDGIKAMLGRGASGKAGGGKDDEE